MVKENDSKNTVVVDKQSIDNQTAKNADKAVNEESPNLRAALGSGTKDRVQPVEHKQAPKKPEQQQQQHLQQNPEQQQQQHLKQEEKEEVELKTTTPNNTSSSSAERGSQRNFVAGLLAGAGCAGAS